MEQEDARKLSSGAQHERRRQVIRAYKRGVNRHRIAQQVGLSYTAVRLIEFFEALIKQAGRGVFLVLDNLGVHHCAPVKKWLAEHTAQIEVFYLPSYSPELNPDERLNGDLKHAIETRVPCRTKDKLRNAASEHMTAIENNPDRVQALFKDPSVKYAA